MVLQKGWADVKKQYKLVEQLGEGAEGEVVKAQNRATKQIVAIKLVPVRMDDNYEVFKYLIREIQILRQFTQMPANIFTTKLMDVVISEEAQQDITKLRRVFLVMEYADQDLKSLILRDSETEIFSDGHKLTIIYNMLCGMNYLHTANIMHRDIKPANILIDSNCTVKYCDFGLSAQLSVSQRSMNGQKHRSGRDDEGGSPLTQHVTGASAPSKQPNTSGTKKMRSPSPHMCARWYRAPEIILNAHYGSQVDIWSLGCVIGELFHNKESVSIPGNKVPSAILFPGTSCYPLSPAMRNNKHSETQEISPKDQLLLIFKAIGAPTDDEIAFLPSSQQEYLNLLQEMIPLNTDAGFLENRFGHLQTHQAEILKQTLQFNPANRLTAYDIIQFKCFDKIRCKSLEQPAPFEVCLSDLGEDTSIEEYLKLLQIEIDQVKESLVQNV